MKKNVFVFIVMICSCIALAASSNLKNTPLTTNNDNWGHQTRSVLSVPELYQNSDTIFIYSDYTLYNVNVTITDGNNETIQSDIITVTGGEEYPYLVDVAGGTYKITLTQGNKYLYGYFTIE